MANPYFEFKQFTVYQQQCAMKVGTDGVLLGAFAMLESDTEANLLDIGSGTGVVALIAAQRNTNLQIDAVEIDPAATEQCAENFGNSPWAERLRVFNTSVQDFLPEKQYRFIVSNPPYFIDSLKSDRQEKNRARHADSLSYDELIAAVLRLMTPDGVFSAVFPYAESNVFIAKAANRGLYCVRRLDVRGVASKPIKRVLLQFSFQRQEIVADELTIEKRGGGDYTDKYKKLTAPFYLKF